MSDLKPCPFCGGEANFWTRNALEAEDYQALIIDCKDCPANMEEWVYKYDKNFVENFEKKKAEMFEAWNRRIEKTAKVVKIAKVIKEDNIYICDNCSGLILTPFASYKYCPECGVKLDWNDDE